MTEDEIARMLERRPELLTGPAEVLADAIRWARFPTDLDHITLTFRKAPNMTIIRKKNGTLRKVPFDYMLHVESVIAYATDRTPATEPLHIHVNRYMAALRTYDAANFADIMLRAMHKRLYATPAQIASITFTDHIDRKNPRVTIHATKKGAK